MTPHRYNREIGEIFELQMSKRLEIWEENLNDRESNCKNKN